MAIGDQFIAEILEKGKVYYEKLRVKARRDEK
jgi:hypothetical protein